MSKEIIKTNLKLSDKISLKYNDREVDMSLSDFKTFLDANLEPSSAVLTSNEPLKYKALISQNAPIASTTSVNMLAGQIWTLETYSGLDGIDPFDGLELISGTIRVAGSKYRSNVNLTINFSTTEMSYDGSPYIVSTDANGDLNPFVNTLGIVPSFVYNSSGDNIAKFTGLFADKSKVSHNAQNTTVGGQVDTSIITIDDMGIATLDNTGTPADDILNYSLFSIEIYP